ncbi:MAG: hypothetical protein Q4C95_10860 [Planctomycetia bacterium]|nr:hypothetical protein [Planctomycetia bacterium]
MKTSGNLQEGKKRFLMNSFSGIAAQLTTAFVGLIIVSINLRFLGEELYSIVILAAAAINLLAILNLGLRPTLVRIFSKSLAEQNEEQLKTSLSTSLLFLGTLGMIGFLILLCGIPTFLKLYAIPAEYAASTEFLLICMGLSFLLNCLGVPYNGIASAAHRYDLVNVIIIVSYLTKSFSLLLFYIFFKPSLYYFGCAVLLGSLINYFALIAVCYREIGSNAFFRPRNVRLGIIPTFLALSLLMVLMTFFEGTCFTFPSLILGVSLVEGVKVLGSAMIVAHNFEGMLARMVNALTPLASQDSANNEGKSLGRWAVLSSQLLTLFTALFLLVIIIWGKPALGLWLKPTLAEEVYFPLIILIASLFCSPWGTFYLILGCRSVTTFCITVFWTTILYFGVIWIGTCYYQWGIMEVVWSFALIRILRDVGILLYDSSKKLNFSYFYCIFEAYIKPILILFPFILIHAVINHFFQGKMTILFLTFYGLIIYWAFVFFCWKWLIPLEIRKQIIQKIPYIKKFVKV